MRKVIVILFTAAATLCHNCDFIYVYYLCTYHNFYLISHNSQQLWQKSISYILIITNQIICFFN